MKVVLLESLGIGEEELNSYREALQARGASLEAYARTADEAQLIRELQGADAAIIANMPISGAVLRGADRLKFLDIAFTGVDHVDLEAAREKGIAVSNAAGYATEAVAELTVSQMIQLLRNVKETEERCRHAGTKDGLVGRELSACTVGIVGTGAIGLRVAALLKAFGCEVLGCAPRPKKEAEGLLTYVPMDELLRRSDIVSLHCPLNTETRGLIGEKELRQMKPTALLVNMARGPVADAAALAAALQDGTIAGAALDVFDREPPLREDDPLLLSPRCLVTPHIGFASKESMRKRAKIVFGSLFSWMDGKQLYTVLASR